MKIPLSFLLCLLVSLAAVSAQSDDNKKHKTTSTTVAPSPTTPSTTTTPQPTTPSSTTPPPTTPSTTTPPPTTPSTTTPPPTTPSTTTPPPTTPTPAPTTPTTAEPTSSPTTPAPAPSTTVAPANKEWVVEDPMTHHACIMATMGVTFNLHTPNVSAEMKIDPSSARAEGGNCTWNTSEVLRLVWENNSSMDIVFSQKDKKNYFISALNVSIAYNASGVMKMASFSSQNLTLFMANINSSYACDSAEFPQLKSNNDTEHLDIKVAHLQVEAFRSHINSTSFSSAHYCPGEVPDVVPLVVGICLAGLVLVVVVAYLIGRRRSQASGYHSM